MSAHVHTHPHAEEAGSGSLRQALGTLWLAFGDRGGQLRWAVALRVLAAVVTAVPVGIVAWCVAALRAGSLDDVTAVRASVAVVVAVLVQFGLWYAANHHAWVGTFHAVGAGRVQALRHVQSLPPGDTAARGTGDVSAVLGADYEQVAVFAHNGLMNLLGGIAQPIAVIAGLALVDPAMAGLTAASILVSVPVFHLVNRSFVRQALTRADVLAEANGRIVEYVQGIATARTYDRVGPRLQWYRGAVAQMRRVNDELAVRITPLAYAGIGTVFLGVPLVVAVVGRLAVSGRLDGLDAVVFLVVVLRVYAPLVSVAIEVEGLRLTDAALTRIRRLLDRAPQAFPAVPVAQPQLSTGGYDITFDSVDFAYEPGRPVLRGVALTARAGQVTAVVGPSGAGKSTLLALTARFHEPDAGTITLGGVPLPDLTRDQLTAACSIVFQDVYLFHGTIRDNIGLGRPGATQEQIEAAARAAHCHDFVTAMPDGYDSMIGEGGLTLSGGQRQRLAIARALLKDAPVVLLDEATSSLDPVNERDVQAAIAHLTAGRTVIVVAHRLSTVRRADQILVLQAGEVVERGTHPDLIAAGGLYARLWAERERAARWRLDAHR